MSPALRQISISTSTEAEEAVAEMIGRILGCATSSYVDFESGTTQVTAFLPRKHSFDQTKLISGLTAIAKCGLNVAPGAVTSRLVRKIDWAESWKRHFKAIDIGNRLLVKPSWIKKKARRGQSIIILDPGLSFGTGQHATTSFCLEQLVVARTDSNRQLFLDIGTGSGILAIAAAKLGYRPVEAFDFDRDAVRIAKTNAAKNLVSNIVRPTFKDLTRDRHGSCRTHDLVCANLISNLLIEEASNITRRVKKGGRLVLAGILTSQFREVLHAYQHIGFRLTTTRMEKEWQSGLFVPDK